MRKGTTLSFEQLNLHASLLRAIEALHFKAPTAIQAEAIPVALSGRDLMASAQTGTGKTAAFVLPALQRLLTPSAARGNGPRVLVLTPTRELATQVTDNIAQLSRFCRLTSGSIVGGLPYPKQIRLLQQPLDLLVATPGRLMDHMERGRVDFSRLELLVLDEADRMLDMGFVDAVKAIAVSTPATRQTLLFSATLEGRVLEVARQLLKNPERIQLAANTQSHASIAQTMHVADDVTHKHALLDHWLKTDGMYQAVVFAGTKRGADKLAKRLTAEGHKSAALHGNMNQNQRKRTVDQMRRGNVRVLVATDVAARGLDIQGISHVINFDLPMVAEDYIHRIGRTGRGGASGMAITLVTPEERGKWRAIERLTGRRLDALTVDGLEPKRSLGAGGGGVRPAANQARRRPSSGQGRPSRGAAPARRESAAPRNAGGYSAFEGRGRDRDARSERPHGQTPARRSATQGRSFDKPRTPGLQANHRPQREVDGNSVRRSDRANENRSGDNRRSARGDTSSARPRRTGSGQPALG